MKEFVQDYGLLGVVILLVFVIPGAGWLTHVFHTIQNGEWFILIAGAIMFPIGITHGIGIWFGIW